jgi:thiamine-phosphate pyrophosphorylase
VTAQRVRGLYAVTPDIAATERLVELTAAALRGGVKLVQYRNKVAPDALRREQALAMKTLCDAHGAALIVNDDFKVAAAVDAAGVHLGRDDPSADAAREAVGRGKLIGVSCYDSFERAREAQESGADYVAFGSFFASRVKPGAVRAPIDLITRAKRELQVPVVAIGGITVENASELVHAGVDAVAVISALFDAADVTAAARRFNALFG